MTMNRTEWAAKFRGGMTSFGSDYDNSSRSGNPVNRHPSSHVDQANMWGANRPVSSAAGDIEDVGISAIEPEVQADIQAEGNALLASDAPLSSAPVPAYSSGRTVQYQTPLQGVSTFDTTATAAHPVQASPKLYPTSVPLPRPAPQPAPAPVLHPATAGLLNAPSGTNDLLIAGGIGIALLAGLWLWKREER